MDKNIRKLGFIYFKEPAYTIKKQVDAWLPALSQLGASFLVFEAGFDRNIPEDVFICAEENGLDPIVHFNLELPLARKFNDVATILDAYARWGVHHVILGDKPNIKAAWPQAGWHYENLVDHFLDRFIPLANHALRIGIVPVLPPMQPGGDYWDTAFVELIANGLKRRKMDDVINQLVLSSYGYTFEKSLSWGQGGPERWSASKPYLTPEGQEDQLGFHNFEWVQAHVQRQLGEKQPIIVLDAGNPGDGVKDNNKKKALEDIRSIITDLRGDSSLGNENPIGIDVFDDAFYGCCFDLDTLNAILDDPLSVQWLQNSIFAFSKSQTKTMDEMQQPKKISNYLLLPAHQAGVSDAVLNKVRPVIKKYKPTIGFSLNEAIMAQKVLVYPDSQLFTDEQLNQLRASGCTVEVLPESGIDIATFLQE